MMMMGREKTVNPEIAKRNEVMMVEPEHSRITVK